MVYTKNMCHQNFDIACHVHIRKWKSNNTKNTPSHYYPQNSYNSYIFHLLLIHSPFSGSLAPKMWVYFEGINHPHKNDERHCNLRYVHKPRAQSTHFSDILYPWTATTLHIYSTLVCVRRSSCTENIKVGNSKHCTKRRFRIINHDSIFFRRPTYIACFVDIIIRQKEWCVAPPPKKKTSIHLSTHQAQYRHAMPQHRAIERLKLCCG